MGQGLGRGFPMGLSFFVRIPQARPLLSPAGSSSGSWLQGGTQGGWTESSLPLLSPSHQTIFLSARCLQGPDPLSGILTLWSLSPLCVSCTKCSTPNTGHNVEGDGSTIQVCQSRIQLLPTPTPRGKRKHSRCMWRCPVCLSVCKSFFKMSRV